MPSWPLQTCDFGPGPLPSFSEECYMLKFVPTNFAAKASTAGIPKFMHCIKSDTIRGKCENAKCPQLREKNNRRKNGKRNFPKCRPVRKSSKILESLPKVQHPRKSCSEGGGMSVGPRPPRATHSILRSPVSVLTVSVYRLNDTARLIASGHRVLFLTPGRRLLPFTKGSLPRPSQTSPGNPRKIPEMDELYKYFWTAFFAQSFYTRSQSAVKICA